MTDGNVIRNKRIRLVQALYRRLAKGTLQANDLLDSKDAVFEDLRPFMRLIYNDNALFQQYFSTFIPTYDIFRVFGADAVILDVGAHWGYSALAMRRQGAKAKIISVEAVHQNAVVLEVLKELEAGRYDYIECAATEKSEKLQFYIPAVNGVANTGSSSTGGTLSNKYAFLVADLAPRYAALEGQNDRFQLINHKINGRPLDAITKALGITNSVQAIKMDIEGHEASAIRGAWKLINKQRPLMMVEGANTDIQVVEIMKQLNYIHFDRTDGKLVRKKTLSKANDGFWLHSEKLDHYRELGLFKA
jgi:FkbM family methyltransferase